MQTKGERAMVKKECVKFLNKNRQSILNPFRSGVSIDNLITKVDNDYKWHESNQIDQIVGIHNEDRFVEKACEK